jgi:amino acid transporter
LGFFFAVTFNLGDIATITSTVFTAIYLFVIVSHIKLRKKYGGNLFLLSFNILLLSAVFVELLIYQWRSHRHAFYGTIITFAAAIIAEYLYRLIRNRKLTEHHKKQFNEKSLSTASEGDS